MAQLTTDTFALTRALRGVENTADAPAPNSTRLTEPATPLTNLNISPPPATVEERGLTTSKPEVLTAAKMLSEQHADLHQVHTGARNSVILKTAASLAVFVPSAAYCLMSFTADHLLSTGEILGAVGGGIGAALAALYFSTDAGPAIVHHLSNRKNRHPEYAESAAFNEAKTEHLNALFYTDRAEAAEKYAAAMARATPVIQVKCAYGLMDLVDRFVDPSDRASAVAKLCENASKELDGTKILKRAAQEISTCAAKWIADSLPSKRVDRARWVESTCVKAFPKVDSESESLAVTLLEAGNSLQSIPAARHILLRAAYAMADPALVTKGNIEELLIGNAQLLGAKVRFDALKDISQLKGISQAGLDAVAGQLEQVVPSLGADDAIVANRMIRDLVPKSYELSRRAKERVAR